MILRAVQMVRRDPSRAWLLTRMAWWVIVLSVLARILPLPRALQVVSTEIRSRRNGADQNQLVTAIDALLATNFFVFKQSCWKRAVVLHRFFALAGVATKIQFGVRKEADGELKGHAWIERDGQPIFESSPPLYTVTYTFPSAERLNVELALMT